jgi:glucarate dehydratase
MKIVDYRITPIAFGDPPLRAAFGLHAPYALRTIVEIVADDGITGVSETHGGAAVVADLEAVRGLVIGRDPFRLADLEATIWGGGLPGADGSTPWEGKLSSPARTFGAIEVACLDLIGKALGRPVRVVLGGRVRKSGPFMLYVYY